MKRKWKQFNLEVFKNRIVSMNWEVIYEQQVPDIAYDIFENYMKTALDEQIPIKKVQPSKNKKNWVSEDTVKLIKTRDKLRKTAVDSNLTEDWNEFRRTRNKVTESQTR